MSDLRADLDLLANRAWRAHNAAMQAATLDGHVARVDTRNALSQQASRLRILAADYDTLADQIDVAP